MLSGDVYIHGIVADNEVFNVEPDCPDIFSTLVLCFQVVSFTLLEHSMDWFWHKITADLVLL